MKLIFKVGFDTPQEQENLTGAPGCGVFQRDMVNSHNFDWNRFQSVAVYCNNFLLAKSNWD